MKQEEKEILLIKDLCARLPYGVKVYDTKGNFDSSCQTLAHINGLVCEAFVVSGFMCRTAPIVELKPYLFPMSSITKEQRKYIRDNHVLGATHELFDWLNKNHFDYRGLIPMGLAIDATGLNIY